MEPNKIIPITLPWNHSTVHIHLYAMSKAGQTTLFTDIAPLAAAFNVSEDWLYNTCIQLGGQCLPFMNQDGTAGQHKLEAWKLADVLGKIGREKGEPFLTRAHNFCVGPWKRIVPVLEELQNQSAKVTHKMKE